MQDTTAPAPGEDKPLRLTVLDEEDLAVVSALLQDAEATLSDMAFLPRQARFALVVSRFDWTAAMRGSPERCRAGLHFERVLHVARSGLPAPDPDLPLRLLAIAFAPEDAPGGAVVLTFIGGAQIKLEVECLEAEMRDIGPRWPVEAQPMPLPAGPGPGVPPAA